VRTPALCVRVRPWGADRGLDGLDADGGEHRVERRGELSIAVTDEEAEATTGLFEAGREVADVWVTQGLSGLVVTPRRWTTLRSTSITRGRSSDGGGGVDR
jgi:hypothetical protein